MAISKSVQLLVLPVGEAVGMVSTLRELADRCTGECVNNRLEKHQNCLLGQWDQTVGCKFVVYLISEVHQWKGSLHMEYSIAVSMGEKRFNLFCRWLVEL